MVKLDFGIGWEAVGRREVKLVGVSWGMVGGVEGGEGVE